VLFEEFGSVLGGICSRSPLAANKPLAWTIIANPKAGGFTIKSRWKKHYALLRQSLQKADNNPLRAGGPSGTAVRNGGTGLVLTQRTGHASEITIALIEEARARISEQNGPFHLIITAGGDGTSLEVLDSLYRAPKEIRENFAVLRLPMGTGNDGADDWELDKALDLLILPAEITRQRALSLTTASGKGPFLAFNVLSVGLDAFVTHMTNRMKGRLPGDSYKLWVDIAALFYDRVYRVGIMEVNARDWEGKEVKALREKLLLLAVGESGRRTYGSHKWILPDERNVCAMRQMSVFRKLALKGLFAYGTHIDKPEAILWNARSIKFTSQYPILAQMDGETVLLEDGDFPALIELSEPAIPVLKLG
jgi:diacylglycerol kinase family enzyme